MGLLHHLNSVSQLQIPGCYLKFETRVSQANAVLREIYRSVVTKQELSTTVKTVSFRSSFVSIFT